MGRIAAGIGRAMTKPGLVAGGAIGAGVTAGLFGQGSPWRQEVFPTIQETLTGDPNFAQNVAKANFVTTWSGEDQNEYKPGRYYYGRPVDPTEMVRYNSSGRAHAPVSGDVVFGMYNLRR